MHIYFKVVFSLNVQLVAKLLQKRLVSTFQEEINAYAICCLVVREALVLLFSPTLKCIYCTL